MESIVNKNSLIKKIKKKWEQLIDLRNNSNESTETNHSLSLFVFLCIGTIVSSMQSAITAKLYTFFLIK